MAVSSLIYWTGWPSNSRKRIKQENQSSSSSSGGSNKRTRIQYDPDELEEIPSPAPRPAPQNGGNIDWGGKWFSESRNLLVLYLSPKAILISPYSAFSIGEHLHSFEIQYSLTRALLMWPADLHLNATYWTLYSSFINTTRLASWQSNSATWYSRRSPLQWSCLLPSKIQSSRSAVAKQSCLLCCIYTKSNDLWLWKRPNLKLEASLYLTSSLDHCRGFFTLHSPLLTTTW